MISFLNPLLTGWIPCVFCTVGSGGTFKEPMQCKRAQVMILVFSTLENR